MKCYSLSEFSQAPKTKPRFVVVGAFDGVHRGHQHLVSTTRQSALENGGELIVLTFWPPPNYFLAGHRFQFLTTKRRRAQLFEHFGADALVTIPFDAAMANRSAWTFAADVLDRQLQADQVVVGYNFTFGRNAEGHAARLEALAAQLGFEVTVLPPVFLGGKPVSSTRIRHLLMAGDVASAAHLLGRFHDVTGRVIPGETRGRKLGFPTANLRIHSPALLPAKGVYAVEVAHNDTALGLGVANVGSSPTFSQGQSDSRSVEVHLIDKAGNWYGEALTVYFLAWLRKTKVFDHPDKLTAQIARDVRVTKQLARTDARESLQHGLRLC